MVAPVWCGAGSAASGQMTQLTVRPGGLAAVPVRGSAIPGDHAVLDHADGQRGAGAYTQLAHGRVKVPGHGLRGQEQPLGDLAVGPPRNQDPGHVELARREPVAVAATSGPRPAPHHHPAFTQPAGDPGGIAGGAEPGQATEHLRQQGRAGLVVARRAQAAGLPFVRQQRVIGPWQRPPGRRRAGASTSPARPQAKDIPTTPGAFQRKPGDLSYPFFLAELEGKAVRYATYFGGTGSRCVAGPPFCGIAGDITTVPEIRSGVVYLGGATAAPAGIPVTPGAFQASYPGGINTAWAARLGLPAHGGG